MSIILIISIVLRLAALFLAIRLWYKIKDWRLAFIGAMVALMALRQYLTLTKKEFQWSLEFSINFVEIPGLLVSVLAVLAIIFIGRMILSERKNSSELSAINKKLVIQFDKREKAEAEKLSFSQVIELNPETIFITNLKAEIEYVNNAFIQSTGYSKEEVLGKNPRILKSNKTPVQTFEDLWANLKSGESWQGELVNRNKDGTEFIEWAIISPIQGTDGEVSHYMAIKKDITERKKAEDEIFNLAYYDTLTNLPNRTLLLDKLDKSLNECFELNSHGILFVINIDRFKYINEARGHPIADVLLKAIGKRFSGIIDHDQILFKLDSDEFTILLPKLGQSLDLVNQHALIMAKKIHESLRLPVKIDNEELSITASMGITVFPEGNKSVSQILRKADMALNKAKSAGGNQHKFFESEMSKDVEAHFVLERELRQAIVSDQLCLYLQSKVDSDHKIVGAEVLVRWMHPERGMISPGLFIPLAEETDLIINLSEWVFSKAMGLISTQNLTGAIPLSLNLSPRHFRQANFITWIKDLIHTSGIKPSDLVLEVTEGLVIDDIESVIEKMNILSELGIKFSIDDFGTGYSSLAYLKRLPVNELKIDKTFIQDAPESSSDAALVETMITFAEFMGMEVVAEGVETQLHADFLKKHKKVIFQGYLFGRPEPAEEWLNKNYASIISDQA